MLHLDTPQSQLTLNSHQLYKAIGKHIQPDNVQLFPQQHF